MDTKSNTCRGRTRRRPDRAAAGWIASLAVILLTLVAAPGAGAATTAEPAAGGDIAPAEVDALLAGLTDAQARALLAAELRRRAEIQAGPTRTAHGGFGVALVEARKGIEALTANVHRHTAALGAGFAALPEALPGAIAAIGGQDGLLDELGYLLLVLVLGGAAAALARSRLTGLRARLEAETEGGALLRSCRLAARAAIEFVPIAVFALVALGIGAVLLQGDGALQDFVISYVTGALVIAAGYVGSRLLYAPYAPGLRLFPLGNRLASQAHRWTVAVIAIGTVAWLTTGLLVLSGVPMPVHLALVALTGGVMAVTAMAMVLALRGAVAGLIAGADPASSGALRLGLARGWHWLALLYLVAVYCLWTYNMVARNPTAVWAAIGSVAVLLAVPLVDRALGRLLDGIVRAVQTRVSLGGTAPDMLAAAGPAAAAPASGPDSDGAPAVTVSVERPGVAQVSGPDTGPAVVARPGARALDVTRTIGRGAIGALAALALLDLWGLDPIALAGPGAQAAFWSGIVHLAVTIGVAWLVWQVISSLIDPHLPAPKAAAAGEDEHEAPMTRAQTLLPLLRTTILVVVLVVTVMSGLSALGVDIAPLLAGAGVIGLAIGFGAQALVKDIVSGIFFLIDDAFRVGEYVEFGDLRGEVEAISLRSLKLRHHRGAVHTVPFGELRSVTNYNRDWVIYKMEFRLPADTDIEKVRKIVKKIGQDMHNDPEHGPKMLAPLKSQGISRIDENAMIVRTKFMCKPREQFMLRREAFTRIQKAFTENGIEFAPRTVRVAPLAAVAGADAAAPAPGAGASPAAAAHGAAALGAVD